MLELLEGAARREPHRQPAVGHRRQRIGRTLPVVGDDLAALERGRRAVGQRRGEEPGIEPARQGRRRHPARQRDQAIGPQPEVELGGERRQRSSRPRAAPSGQPPRGRAGRSCPPAARRPPRTARGSRPRGRPAPAPARGRRRARRRPRPPIASSAPRAQGPRRRRRPGRRGRRARPARRPSSPAGGSAAPPARPAPDGAGRRSRRGAVQPARPARPARRSPAVSAGQRRGELLGQRGRVRHRQPAGEVAADVRGRPAVEREAVVEERHGARRRVGRDRE